MKILFLTLDDIRSIDEYGIYQDLLRSFVRRGDEVYIVSPTERRNKERSGMLEGKCKILKVRIGNTTKTNLLEKGISTLLLELQFKGAIKRYLKDVKFDLVLYSTPPITLAGAIRYVKNRDGAKTYLMLKDNFPQNAVDMGMFSKTGVKSVMYRYFRWKEKQLYKLSDWIGCMSPANVDYIRRHEPQIEKDRVELCPNSMDIRDFHIDGNERAAMREKYGIPQDKTVFVYGGNLGRPQGIPFIMECLERMKNHSEAFFLIVGSGTEYGKLESFVEKTKPTNVRLMRQLPKDDYDRMVAACDVGLIFLDHCFTIPNFPSRLLSYMQVSLPVLACTDPNTDMGKVITEGGFGWWCESNDAEAFCRTVETAVEAPLKEMGARGRECLLKEYDVKVSRDAILSHMDA